MVDWDDLRLGGVAVCDCRDEDEADLCVFVLNKAGIQAVRRQSTGKLDLRWPQILVAPDDAERARALLAAPLCDEDRAEWEADQMEVEDLPAVACPRCGSDEILLEDAEPLYRWQCDGCGHRWQDADGDGFRRAS